MSWQGYAQILLFFVAVFACVKPLGSFMARVYEGNATWAQRVLGPFERLLYRVLRVDAKTEMSWKTYACAALFFNAAGILVVYVLQRAQGILPLNHEGFGAVPHDLAVNTAVSFATNTNWQAYGGESTLSALVQMVGLTVQNFVSAATAMAVVIAFVRAFSRKSVATIGNFWFDVVRSTLYILVPLSIVVALVLVSQGVVQTFASSVTAPLLEATKDEHGQAITTQVLSLGPAASQVAIKQLGTNGGGFFNANSAHPFENPTPLANFIQTWAIFVIPAALCYTFGLIVKDVRQGWAILFAMSAIFVPLLLICVFAEQAGNPALHALGVDQSAGNMEGKEVRFGISASALFTSATTAASCGAVNNAHDSLTPIGGFVPLFLMQLGEIVFGGVGSGLYGMLMFAVIAVFVAGLMVGRTPEYLGKKIEAFEMKMASLVILIPASAVLVLTAIAVATEAGQKGVMNPGAHGFSEILYAYSSASNNNGSAFGGLSANSVFYNLTTALAMLLGRYGVMIPVLAVAGSLASKKKVPASAGTLPTHTPLFVAMLIGIILVVGALTFIPALALGPVVEQLLAKS